MSDFSKKPLNTIFSIHRNSINPYQFPKEKFYHHSIPAYDLHGGPELQRGQAIESNKTLIESPSVLVSKLNPRKNRVGFAIPGRDEYRHCCSTEFIAYTPISENTELRFYKWYFQCEEFRSRLTRVATGTTNSHVRVTPYDTLAWPIPEPTIEEQRAIATVLDTMDEVIRRTEAVLAKLRQVKAGMLHDLLTLGLDENGELRDPIRHPEQFKDSPLGRIPKSWDITPLGFIIQMLKTGVSVNAWGRPTSGELPGVLKTSCVHSGLFLPEENKTVFQRDIYRVSCPVKADSIIISRMNTPFLVGESGYVDADFPYLFLPDRLWITEMRTERVTSVKWLSYVLNWEPVRKKIRDIATGTSGSMKNISQNDFLSIEIITPNPSEQKDIANRLSSIDKLLGRETNLLSKLVKQKQGLMHDLLTGRGRVSRLLEAMP